MHSPSDRQLISDFYSRDVLLGDRAVKKAIELHGDHALRLIIPIEGGYGVSAPQVEQRLRRLAVSAGASAVDYLTQVVEHGSWTSQQSAAPAFAGLRDQKADAAHKLVGVLEKGEVDAQRLAIEALGYLGAHEKAYSIAEFAETGQWQRRDSFHRGPNRYTLDKFYSYVAAALIRMTAALERVDHIRSCLGEYRDFLQTCNENLGHGRITEWDIRFLQHHFPARAADALVKEWIASDSELLQKCAVEALGHLRLSRQSAYLVSVLQDQRFSDSVRQSAGISLSQFAEPGAAAELAKHMAHADASPGVFWAFAALYAHDVTWPKHDRLADVLLDERNADDETSSHFIYALACRGDPRAERCFQELNAPQPYRRGPAAIACVRHDVERALRALPGRDDEASDAMERACILAAQIHAGQSDKVDLLHQELTVFDQLPLLRPIWKREILYAFFVAEGNDSERGRLWCEAALEHPKRVIAEMETILWRKGRGSSNALRSNPSSVQSDNADSVGAQGQSQKRKGEFDVFISHASEDKEALVEPLYQALYKVGVRVWFDKTELRLGDSLRRKIDDGLAHCRYGVVVLSPSFFDKEWPMNELGALMARETITGATAILPIWHNLEAKDLIRRAPMLADRFACRSSEGIDAIVKRIQEVLND